jgi:hypothetical protein
VHFGDIEGAMLGLQVEVGEKSKLRSSGDFSMWRPKLHVVQVLACQLARPARGVIRLPRVDIESTLGERMKPRRSQNSVGRDKANLTYLTYKKCIRNELQSAGEAWFLRSVRHEYHGTASWYNL